MSDSLKIRVMLVDDQQLMLDGLRTLLEIEPDFKVVAECRDGSSAIEAYEQSLPDIVLMDIRMPKMDGVEATGHLCQRWPDANIIILTTFDDDAYVFNGIRAGAAGFLLKAVRSAELIRAIRTVVAGGGLLDPSVTRRVMAEVAKFPTHRSQQELADPLSGRELEILNLLAKGYSNRKIAYELHLVEGTIKNYVSRVLQKLQVSDRTQAALKARELGLLSG